MEKIKISAYAPVNGLNMYYEIYGNGTMPLVLIHGGGSTIETTFGSLLPLLSGYGKLIAVELHAHGRKVTGMHLNLLSRMLMTWLPCSNILK